MRNGSVPGKCRAALRLINLRQESLSSRFSSAIVHISLHDESYIPLIKYYQCFRFKL